MEYTHRIINDFIYIKSKYCVKTKFLNTMHFITTLTYYFFVRNDRHIAKRIIIRFD